MFKIVKARESKVRKDTVRQEYGVINSNNNDDFLSRQWSR